MHLLQTTMRTATVYDHFGISLEYINLRHCHQLKVFLLRRYRCLRRSNDIKSISYNQTTSSTNLNRQIVVSYWQLWRNITRIIYTNSSESILVHRRTRLRDAHTRAPYIAHCTLHICSYSSNIGYCVRLRGGVIYVVVLFYKGYLRGE